MPAAPPPPLALEASRQGSNLRTSVSVRKSVFLNTPVPISAASPIEDFAEDFAEEGEAARSLIDLVAFMRRGSNLQRQSSRLTESAMHESTASASAADADEQGSTLLRGHSKDRYTWEEHEAINISRFCQGPPPDGPKAAPGWAVPPERAPEIDEDEQPDEAPPGRDGAGSSRLICAAHGMMDEVEAKALAYFLHWIDAACSMLAQLSAAAEGCLRQLPAPPAAGRSSLRASQNANSVPSAQPLRHRATEVAAACYALRGEYLRLSLFIQDHQLHAARAQRGQVEQAAAAAAAAAGVTAARGGQSRASRGGDSSGVLFANLPSGWSPRRLQSLAAAHGPVRALHLSTSCLGCQGSPRRRQVPSEMWADYEAPEHADAAAACTRWLSGLAAAGDGLASPIRVRRSTSPINRPDRAWPRSSVGGRRTGSAAGGPRDRAAVEAARERAAWARRVSQRAADMARGVRREEALARGDALPEPGTALPCVEPPSIMDDGPPY